MRRLLALTLLLSLLTGCAGTPQSREVGATAVVSVLGAEPAGRDLRLLAAAEGRGGEDPFLCDSQGATPAAAVEGLTNRGEQVVSCAHVEHLLLARSAAGELPDLLSYAFQEPQQSTETQLWVVRADTLGTAFAGPGDVAKRMAVIKTQGKNRQGFAPLTLREAAAILAQGKSLFIPALAVGDEGVAFDGYALYQDGTISQWLTGQQALGAALLQGERIHWTGSGERGAMTLQSTGCRVSPQWEGETLTGLALHCHLEASPTGGWQGEGTDLARLEEETAQSMVQALEVLQQAGTDAVDLLGKAGLAQPFRWARLKGQWQEAFPSLFIQVTVTITLSGDL